MGHRVLTSSALVFCRVFDKDHDKDDDGLVWLSCTIATGAEKWFSKVDFFKMRISTASPSTVQWWWSWSCLIEFCNCKWSSSQSALQREVARVTLFRLLFQHLFFLFPAIFLLVFPTSICFTQSALRRGMTRATLFRFIKIYLFSFYLFVWFSIKPYINNVFFLHIISFTSEARSNTTFQMRR